MTFLVPQATSDQLLDEITCLESYLRGHSLYSFVCMHPRLALHSLVLVEAVPLHPQLSIVIWLIFIQL